MITKRVFLFLYEENVMRQLAGNGAGYKDGEPGSAQFRKPRSFAIDVKGNVYVADKSNYVIRKITNSGLLPVSFLLAVAYYLLLL